MEEIIIDEFVKSKKNVETGKLALFSLHDEQLTDYTYDSIEPMEPDYWVEAGEYWGIIDKNGKFLVTMSNLKTDKINVWKHKEVL